MIRTALVSLLLLFLLGCSSFLYHTIDEDTPPPVGWPKLVTEVHRVSQAKMRDECAPYTGADVTGGCAIIDLIAGTCVVWLDNDFPVDGGEEHELKHCEGYDHPGGTSIKKIMQDYNDYLKQYDLVVKPDVGWYLGKQGK